jgi:hypothetical protein
MKMKSNREISFLLAFFSIAILAVACSGGGGGDNHGTDGGDQKPVAHRINWENIPTQFNPRIQSTSIDVSVADTIKLDLFGFQDDVSVSYSSKLNGGSATLEIYTVYQGSASFGSLNQSQSQGTVSVVNNGTYQCSIKVDNGSITDLKGGCYVRVNLVLPAGSQIEAYNVDKLISKRFKAMSNDQLLVRIEATLNSADRFKIIDEYLSSYSAVSKAASINTSELGKVIHEFSFKDDKLIALRKLQAAVADRTNLEQMIEDEFFAFDQNDARAIVGLPPKAR